MFFIILDEQIIKFNNKPDDVPKNELIFAKNVLMEQKILTKFPVLL